MKNFRLQYTSWEEMPAEVKAFFVQWMGNDVERARAFYKLYFHWYTISHEVGHVLRAFYSTRSGSHWHEETTVNSFAVAYWRARGETERLEQVHQFLRDALSRLKDPTPQGESRSGYFDTHYSELGSNPPAYGYYQFSMVLTALGEELDFAKALRIFITPQAKEATPPPASPYATVDPSLPPHIVGDMRNYLASFGIDVPEIKVIRAFSPKIIFVNWDDS